jgi:hypothetical protein
MRPSRTTVAVAATLSLAVLGGCASSNGAQPGSADSGTIAAGGGAGSLPCDVDAVLAAHCRTCHGATPAYGAPMSLVTYGDLTAPSKTDPTSKVYQLIAVRIHNDASPMPPPPNARLSAAESSVLDAWIGGGAPHASAATCAGASGGDSGAPVETDGGVDPESLPCTPDTFIHPASPYSAPPSAEEYVCYGFDVTTSQKRHVIALSPDIDNKAVVHHLLLYKTPQAVSGTPAPCGGAALGELVTGWAPGVGNLILPPEAGFPEEATTHYMMQIHYNNVAGTTAQNDSSGYKLCTTDKLRANDASVLAFGSTNFTIPALGSLALTCDYTFANSTIHAFVVQAHMHLRGRAMTTTNTTGAYTVVDVPNFDFQSQYLHDVSFDINSGDVIRNTCTWANTTDQPISYGPTTEDEMCFDFVSYWPKITTPGFSWITPSLSSSCTSK